MFCVSSPNCRVFAQVIHTLAKIGDDVLFEPRNDSLVLKTKNMAESSYAEIEFQSNFFSSFSFNPALYQEDATNFKIAMRSLVSVVKSPHSFDKNVETCLLKYEPGKYQLIVTINYSKGTTKEYIIPHIEYESFEANFSKSDAKNFILSDACTLISATNQFKSGEDEITLSSEKENSVLENHLQNAKDCKTTVKTTVRVDHQYLETYSINFPTKITFCLKEFKALLALSENVRLPIGFYFDSPGKPLILEVSEANVFRINVLISTLQTSLNDQQTPSQSVPVASTSSNCNQNNRGSQTSAQDSTRSRNKTVAPEMTAGPSNQTSFRASQDNLTSNLGPGVRHTSQTSQPCASASAPDTTRSRNRTVLPESNAGPSNQTSFRASQDNLAQNLEQGVGHMSQNSQHHTTNNTIHSLQNGTPDTNAHHGSQRKDRVETQDSYAHNSNQRKERERTQDSHSSQRKEQERTQDSYVHNGSQQQEDLEGMQNDPPIVSQNYENSERCNSQAKSQKSNTQHYVENLTPNDFTNNESQHLHNNSRSVPLKQKVSLEAPVSEKTTSRSKKRYFDDDDFDVEAFVLKKHSNGNSEAVNSINKLVQNGSKKQLDPEVERLYSTIFKRCFKSVENQRENRPKILVYNSDGLSDSD